MFDYQTFKLVHLHGDERFAMEERDPHDSAAHDPERGWGHGEKLYRCAGCDEEIVLTPTGGNAADGEAR